MAENDEDDRETDEASGDVDLTGWDRTGDEMEQRKRNRRKRITLDVFAGPALELPRASRHDAIPPKADDASTELQLPDLKNLPRFGVSSGARARPPSGELTKIEDAWSRARDAPDAVPPRPRTETPPPFDISDITVTGQNDAVALVSRRSRPPGSSVLDLAGEMLDRFALGDFSGALLAAEIVLGKDPTHAEAQRCAATSRDRLSDMHLARLGGAAKRPQIAVAGSEVRWLGLDHRAGFLLSRVDGQSTVEELVDLSGMPRHEALKVLVELIDAGALSLTGR